jgi:hypothetical protein
VLKKEREYIEKPYIVEVEVEYNTFEIGYGIREGEVFMW